MNDRRHVMILGGGTGDAIAATRLRRMLRTSVNLT